MTFLHVYFLGFVGMMAICAVAFYPLREHNAIQANLLTWTLSIILACALWPLVLIAALVAATDR